MPNDICQVLCVCWSRPARFRKSFIQGQRIPASPFQDMLRDPNHAVHTARFTSLAPQQSGAAALLLGPLWIDRFERTQGDMGRASQPILYIHGW